MITDRDIRTQVLRSIDGHDVNMFHIEAIVDEIKFTYGLVDIDMIDRLEYWAIILRHYIAAVYLMADPTAAVGQSWPGE